MTVLQTITDGDLKELGVGSSFGERRRILIAIKSLAQQEGADHDMDGASEVANNLPPTAGQLDAGNSMPTPPKGPLTYVLPFTNPAEYNITEILTHHAKGNDVLDELWREGVLTVPKRRLLIQIVVAFLVENGGKKLYPTSEQKTALAKAVISEFPALRDTFPGAKGHEYLYDGGHGFIEYKLKTLRSYKATHQGTPTKPKTIRPADQDDAGSEEEADAEDLHPVASPEILRKVEWMKYHHPTPENTTMLKSNFKETFPHRRREMKRERLSITDVLVRYPRFQDMPSLIDLEFQMQFGQKCDNLLSSWRHTYFPRIMAVGRSHSSAANILKKFEQENADLCAFYILSHLIPSSNAFSCRKGGKKMSGESRAAAVGHLFQHEPDGTDVAAYAARKPSKLTQPFLLCLGPEVQPSQFFVILDNRSVPAGEDIVAAFDRLFKTFYVFDVQYPPCLHALFLFFASIIYQCSGDALTPQLRAFNVLLTSTRV